MPTEIALEACNHLQLDRSVSKLSIAITDLFAHSNKTVTAPTLEPSLDFKNDYMLCSRRHGILCRDCGLILKNQITYNSHQKNRHNHIAEKP